MPEDNYKNEWIETLQSNDKLSSRLQEQRQNLMAWAWLGNVCGWLMISSSIFWSVQAAWVIYGAAHGSLNNLPVVIGIAQVAAGLLIIGLLIFGIALLQASRKTRKNV